MQENAGLRTIYKQISAGRQQHWSVVTRRILVAEFLLDLLDSNGALTKRPRSKRPQ